jgi:hypothetical protein
MIPDPVSAIRPPVRDLVERWREQARQLRGRLLDNHIADPFPDALDYKEASIREQCADQLLTVLTGEARSPQPEPVTTYTPMLWAVLTEEERYQEYIRVRQALSRIRQLPRYVVEEVFNDDNRFLYSALEEREEDGELLKAVDVLQILGSQGDAPSPQWQAIETAPKDGTPVRLTWKGTTVEATGRWCPADDWPKPFASDDWRDVAGDDVLLMPTHWQPLPPPPGV